MTSLSKLHINFIRKRIILTDLKTIIMKKEKVIRTSFLIVMFTVLLILGYQIFKLFDDNWVKKTYAQDINQYNTTYAQVDTIVKEDKTFFDGSDFSSYATKYILKTKDSSYEIFSPYKYSNNAAIQKGDKVYINTLYDNRCVVSEQKLTSEQLQELNAQNIALDKTAWKVGSLFLVLLTILCVFCFFEK